MTLVNRPWGWFEVIETRPGFLTKRLTLNRGKRISLQRHDHRDEHWIVVSGDATIQIGNSFRDARMGAYAFIHRRETHRLTNIGDVQLIVVEVQTGAILDESDIYRIADDFGRVSR